MRLPYFITNNSPYKMQAMKLLHQFVEKRPEFREKISLFFSETAELNKIDPFQKDAYNAFMRYHQR